MLIDATPEQTTRHAPTVEVRTGQFASSGGIAAAGDGFSSTDLVISETDTDAGEARNSIPEQVKLDWDDSNIQRIYAIAEQKFLAGKMTLDETEDFKAARESRRTYIRAKTYLSDYMEIERLRMLTLKLNELNKYLRPISLR